MTRIQRRPDRHGAFASIYLFCGQGRRLKEAALLNGSQSSGARLHCDFRVHIKLLLHVQVLPAPDVFLLSLTSIRGSWRALTETSLVTIEAARSSNLQRNRPLSGGSLVFFILTDRLGCLGRAVPEGNRKDLPRQDEVEAHSEQQNQTRRVRAPVVGIGVKTRRSRHLSGRKYQGGLLQISLQTESS
jgi:hypothetical protein